MSTVGEIMQTAGPGMGTQIGYTDDGKVFMVLDSRAPDGQPMQTILQWPPEDARRIASSLSKAAETAEEKKKVQ